MARSTPPKSYPVAGAAFAVATLQFELESSLGVTIVSAATLLSSGTNYQFSVPGSFFANAAITPDVYTGRFKITYASGAIGHSPRVAPLSILIGAA